MSTYCCVFKNELHSISIQNKLVHEIPAINKKFNYDNNLEIFIR